MRTVRLATEADAAGILAVYAPYIRDTAVTFETEIPSLDAFRCRMASIIGDYPYLVVEEDGSIVGFAYAHRLGERAAYAWNAELSIYFAPGCTSRGWGSVLFWALIDLLALQGVRNAYSLITVPNEGAWLCMRSWALRSGVQKEAGYKLGAWHDVAWLRMAIGDFSAAPEPRMPLSSMDPDQVTEVLAAAEAALARLN
ncbi:MAG: N-acetyltransferase family protein [Adlercreutzia sp.]